MLHARCFVWCIKYSESIATATLPPFGPIGDFPDFQPMRGSEEPVCIFLFRQNLVFTSLYLRSSIHVTPAGFIFTCVVCTAMNNSKQIFPEKELRGHSPNFQIYVSVNDLYVYTLDWSSYSAAGNMWTDPGSICRNRSQTHLMWKLGLRPRKSQKRNR